MYAWLADPNFTDRGANYSIDGLWIGTRNQYSAPSGWNNVGEGYHNSSGTIELGVLGTDHTTGADGVKVVTFN